MVEELENYGTFVEWHYHGKADELGEKFTLVPVSTPKIPHELA
jgi:hypothetical protein